jgi:hypothetical protein
LFEVPYWSNVVPAAIARLDPGDVFIMISDINQLAPEAASSDSEKSLKLFQTGLERIASELNEKGVVTISQSPIPFIRESMCTPDMAKRQWFNLRDRTPCRYYTKQYSVDRLRQLNQAIYSVQQANRNFHTLDLFSFLCPGDVCRFENSDGVMLYRDHSSHLSIEASFLARSMFISTVMRAVESRVE